MRNPITSLQCFFDSVHVDYAVAMRVETPQHLLQGWRAVCDPHMNRSQHWTSRLQNWSKWQVKRASRSYQDPPSSLVRAPQDQYDAVCPCVNMSLCESNFLARLGSTTLSGTAIGVTYTANVDKCCAACAALPECHGVTFDGT